MAEAITQREAPATIVWAADSLGIARAEAPRLIGALVGLHDFGKGIADFQRKWPSGQVADEAAGLVFRPNSSSEIRHDLASTAILRCDLALRVPAPLWLDAVSAAIGAHHGYFPRMAAIRQAKPRLEDDGWRTARQQLLDAYWRALGLPAAGVATTASELTLPIAAWLAGLTSVSDWVGSNQAWFPPGERHVTIAGHFRIAQGLAVKALDEIGWPQFRPLISGEETLDNIMGRVLGQRPGTVAARPLQSIADELLASSDGPCFMIVEAPMGEGKTEVAFLSHLRLQAANQHRGLYLALPTQATGSALFDRALAFLQQFSADTRLDIQLAHGGAALSDRIAHLRGIANSSAESVRSSAWFSQRKRPLLSPYGAGTIDQALLATLNVKHHFVRIWGLANRVVVLDEVHAYDTYTSGLIEALLRWLKAMRCSVILMSATLPARRRASLMQAWGISEIPDVAYPRVLLATGGQVLGRHAPSRKLPTVAVSGMAEDLQAVVDAARSAVKQGGCGAVIVNTVKRAQQLYRLLQAEVSPDCSLILFHARFPADERLEREKTVLGCFGRDAGASRPARALLIATQVVEQSLDLDFDFMLSDLAPVDLLLQRVGRLHRHARSRPAAHAQARFTVSGLLPDRFPDVEQTAWKYVYDEYVLRRTWREIRARTEWHLPDDIDRLVQAVYEADLALSEDAADTEALDRAYGEHCARISEHRQRAFNAAIDADAEPHLAYSNKPGAAEDDDDVGIKAATRLGDEGIIVVPVFERPDGWRLFPGDAPFDPERCPDDALARRIFRRHVRLANKSIRVALKGTAPPAFEAHPLLCDLVPLVLRGGAVDIGSIRVMLDPELGIVYDVPDAVALDTGP